MTITMLAKQRQQRDISNDGNDVSGGDSDGGSNSNGKGNGNGNGNGNGDGNGNDAAAANNGYNVNEDGGDLRMAIAQL
jgi:hypothetical protein